MTESPRPGARRALAVVGGVALALATAGALVLGQWWPGTWLVVPALAIALLAGLWRSARRGARGWSGRGDEGRRDLRRLLGAAGIGLAITLGGLALAAGSALLTITGGGIVVAAAVIALGAALLASSVIGGRLRWLALPALLLAAPAGLVAAGDLHGEDRGVRVAALAALPADGYEVSAGKLRVDLRGAPWPPGARARLRAAADVGRVLVLVPEQVCVTGRAHAALGGVDVLGSGDGGFDHTLDLPPAPPGSRALVLDAHVGLGAVEVAREPEDRQGRGDPDRRERGDRQATPDQPACRPGGAP